MFQVSVSSFGFEASVFGFRVSGFGFRVSGLRFWGWDSGFGFRVSDFGFQDSGFGFRVSGSPRTASPSLPGQAFRVSGFGFRLRSNKEGKRASSFDMSQRAVPQAADSRRLRKHGCSLFFSRAIHTPAAGVSKRQARRHGASQLGGQQGYLTDKKTTHLRTLPQAYG